MSPSYAEKSWSWIFFSLISLHFFPAEFWYLFWFQNRVLALAATSAALLFHLPASLPSILALPRPLKFAAPFGMMLSTSQGNKHIHLPNMFWFFFSSLESVRPDLIQRYQHTGLKSLQPRLLILSSAISNYSYCLFGRDLKGHVSMIHLQLWIKRNFNMPR